MNDTELEGRTVLDRNGGKIGKIDEVYVDQETQRPEWGVVNTGMLGKKTFVPLIELTSDGDDLRLPYDKSQVTGAPSVDADGEISVEEEAALAAHYGIGYSTEESSTGVLTGRGAGGLVEERIPTGDGDAMTRSEERLRVGTMRRPSEVVRLRKTVVTEPVSETVSLQREELRVEREPITDANIDSATSGAEISEAVHEVTLSQEEPVVEKRTVPVERVRLDKDVVTEHQEVTGEVRKEQIEVEREARNATNLERDRGR